MNTDAFREFFELVKDVWNDAFLGISVGTILIALGVFLLFLLLRNLFTRIVIYQIRRLTQKTRTKFDDLILEAVERPIRLVPVVLGFFFATRILETEGLTDEIIFNINRSLITFTIFWALYRAVKPLGFVAEDALAFLTNAMRDWMIKTMKALIAIMGLVAVLGIWGIEVVPIIAGLGVFGIAVALGAQELFKNLIAGLFVLGEQRFRTNDWINIEGVVDGVVEQIGFRTTKVRRWDKAPLYIPNAHLTDNVVTNFSEMTYRRIYWVIGVEYSTTAKQLRKIRDGIEKFIHTHEGFAIEEGLPTFIRIDKFNDSSIDIMIYCFSRSILWGDYLKLKEELALKVKEIVEGAGTGFAFPSRSLYVETLPDKPEIMNERLETKEAQKE